MENAACIGFVQTWNLRTQLTLETFAVFPKTYMHFTICTALAKDDAVKWNEFWSNKWNNCYCCSHIRRIHQLELVHFWIGANLEFLEFIGNYVFIIFERSTAHGRNSRRKMFNMTCLDYILSIAPFHGNQCNSTKVQFLDQFELFRYLSTNAQPLLILMNVSFSHWSSNSWGGPISKKFVIEIHLEYFVRVIHLLRNGIMCT